jgi:hypothetical protein
MQLTDSQRSELRGLFSQLRSALEKSFEKHQPKLASRTQSLTDELAYCRDEITKKLDAGRAPDFALVSRALTVTKRLGAVLPAGDLKLADLPWSGIGREMSKRLDDSVVTIESGDVCEETVQHCGDVLFSLSAEDVRYQPPAPIRDTDAISYEARKVVAKVRGMSPPQIILALSSGSLDKHACQMTLNWVHGLSATQAQVEDAAGAALNLGVCLSKCQEATPSTIRKCSTAERADAKALKELSKGFDANLSENEIRALRSEVELCISTGYKPPRLNALRKALYDAIAKRSLARRTGLLKRGV